jgi:hypothetical protein
MHHRRVLVVAAAILALQHFSPVSAQAGFVASVTGAAVVIAPPANCTPGVIASNQYQIWQESTGTFSGPVQVDLAGQTGSYDGLTNYTPLSATLAKGTPYDSTMVQLNAPANVANISPMATITFTGKIMGLALFGTSLDATDIYGNPTTVYPHGLPTLFLQTRGIDFAHNDRLAISTDGKTLSLQLTSGLGAIDQIRVFTSTAQAPEPASLAIWAIGGVILGVRCRRSRANRRYSNCL